MFSSCFGPVCLGIFIWFYLLSQAFHFLFSFPVVWAIMKMFQHLIFYPCSASINYFWGQGFLLVFFMVLQVLSGILLGLYFNSSIIIAYFCVMYILREVYFGWSFCYMHSCGASFVFMFIYLHLARALYYGSSFYISLSWYSGILLFFLLMAAAFLGYVLPWGQMSFWGATVITNLLSGVPCLVPWVCGGFFVSNPSLSRFFVFHFLLPFLIIGLFSIHIFYLHQISSFNPLAVSTNNKIPFYPFIFSKDLFFFFHLFKFGFLEIFFGFISLSHPDNGFEVSVLITPLHIVPEWYFLEFYAILKAVPSKNAGFMIMFSSIFSAFIFGENKGISRLVLSPGFTGHYSMSLIFLLGFYFLWTGAQLPQEKFISYSRSLGLILCVTLFVSTLSLISIHLYVKA